MKQILLAIVCLGVFQLSAQEVAVVDFAGLQQRMNEQKKDELVIYNFWATWCKPCVEEMPYFEKLNANYAGKNVKVVFVSLDFKSKHQKVVEFVAKKGLKAEVILLNAPDYNAWIDKVSTDWSGAIPATFVLKGDEHKFHEGSFTYEQLEQFIKPLL